MYTFNKMWGVVTPEEAAAKIEEQRKEITGEPKNLEEQAISLVGRDIYEKLIKGQTHRQTFNDKRWQIFAVTSPLLLCIALDEFLVDIATDKRDGLLFKILWLTSNLFALFFNLCGSLLRRYNSPHLVKGVHVERKGE